MNSNRSLCTTTMYWIKFTEIRNSHLAQKWLYNTCNHKELLFAELRELEASILSFPTTTDDNKYDKIHISIIKHKIPFSIGYLTPS